MVNKPKQTGTFGETAVLKQVLPYFPSAERLVLHGDADQGDIGHCGDFIFEVKAGKQTHQIGDGKLAKWMEEAVTEAANRKVDFGILVTQRRGFGAPNARRWWVHVLAGDLAEIMGAVWLPGRFVTVRMELGDFLDLLGDQGWTPQNSGEPVTDIVLDAHTHTEILDVPDLLTDPTAVHLVAVADNLSQVRTAVDDGVLSPADATATLRAEYAAFDIDPDEEITANGGT